MKNIFKISFMILFLTTVQNSWGQSFEIKIWPDGVPGQIKSNNYKEFSANMRGTIRIYHVTDPTLTAYIVPKEKSSGSAVIICPGGGYKKLAMEIEGTQIAQWLNKLGVSAFVLKYRLPNDTIMEKKSIGPLQDVQEAMRIVRRKAAEWNINTNKIGIMGFSAGGHLASTLSTSYNDKIYAVKDSVSAKPDFSILIYPVISMMDPFAHTSSRGYLLGKTPGNETKKHFSPELNVTASTPPTFLVHSLNDRAVPVESSINYFLALKKQKVPAELHVYQSGGHGYGLAPGGGTESEWSVLLQNWLYNRKYVTDK